MKDNCSADQGCDGGGLGIIQSALRQLWLISIIIISGFTYGSADKESTCNVGNQGSIPRSGRFPGESNGNPLQYFCLENSRDRGTGQAEVHGIAELDMTVRLTVTFTAPPQIIKHQISDVGDPCSRAHTSRSPWRGCFIPSCLPERGRRSREAALLCCSRLQISVPGTLSLHVSRHCCLELSAVCRLLHTARKPEVLTWPFPTFNTCLKCQIQGLCIWLPVSKWHSTEHKGGKKKLDFITHILFLLSGNC